LYWYGKTSFSTFWDYLIIVNSFRIMTTIAIPFYNNSTSRLKTRLEIAQKTRVNRVHPTSNMEAQLKKPEKSKAKADFPTTQSISKDNTKKQAKPALPNFDEFDY
jgi:hypothetical protein